MGQVMVMMMMLWLILTMLREKNVVMDYSEEEKVLWLLFSDVASSALSVTCLQAARGEGADQPHVLDALGVLPGAPAEGEEAMESDEEEEVLMFTLMVLSPVF
jgi:hypothetical protein